MLFRYSGFVIDSDCHVEHKLYAIKEELETDK